MNPELRRLLWLEATPARLVLLPCLIFLLLLAVSLAEGDEAAARTALWSAAALGVIWAPRLAAQALLGEIAANTWDVQRAGALTPWAMAWGKLVGSAAIAWYGMALCLGAAVLLDGGNLAWDDWGEMALTALLAPPGALFAALVLAAAARRGGTLDGFVAHLSGIGFAVATNWLATLTFVTSKAFWGVPTEAWMMPAAMLLIAALAVGACWWRMADALQARAGLWVWPLFLAVFAFLAGGNAYGRIPWAAASFASVLPIAWFALLVDPKPPVLLRRWLRRPDFGGSPAWLQGFAVLLVLAVVLAATGTEADLPRQLDLRPDWMAGFDWRVAALPALAFFLRDAALFHLVAWGGLPGRGIPGAVIYAVVLYGLLPSILGGAGGAGLLWLLLPVPGTALPLALAAPLVQVAILGWLAARRLAALVPAERGA